MRNVLAAYCLLIAGCSAAPERADLEGTLPPQFDSSVLLLNTDREDATSILKVKLSDCPPKNRLIYDADSTLVFCRFDHPGHWRLKEYGGNPYFVKPN